MYIENLEQLDANLILEDDVLEEIFEIESEQDREKVLIKVEARAKQLGVKSEFVRTYKAAMKEFKRKQKEQETAIDPMQQSYVTEFTNEPQLFCGIWRADDNGIYTVSDKGMIVACPHPIYPKGVLVNAETGTFKIQLRYKIHNQWRETIENRETIASSNKIVALASKGIRVTSENAKALVRYLAEVEAYNEDQITEQISTSRLGWINNEQFMPYENEVIFDNEQNLRSLFQSIHSEGFRNVWYEEVKEIRATKRIELQIYLASSLASVLVHPCGALPFIVSLWGGTGLGKTVALMLATSVWADPNEGQYMTDAKATATAMEIRLDCLNSLPMTLDDMAQIKNQYDGDFSELVYRWCAGKGRDRSNQSLGLNKLTNWRNCTLTNGERSLISETMQGGAVNRIIDIEIEDKPLFADGNKTSSIFRKHFGFCGREFVEIIQQIGFDQINKMAEEKIKLVKEIAKQQGCEKEDKQIIPMALILLADEIAEQKLFQDGVLLDAEKCVEFLKNKGEVSEHKRAYEFIKQNIVSQSFHYADDIATELDGKTEQFGFWKDADTIVIFGNIFDKILATGGFQSRAFLSWAKKNNLIECDNQGNYKKLVKVKGVVTRSVVLSR